MSLILVEAVTHALAAMVRSPMTFPVSRACEWLPTAVFAALPVVGLVAGPAYAPILFAMGGIIVLSRATRGRAPQIERPLAVLAVALVLLAWTSTGWSIVPIKTVRSAAQLTAVLAGALAVLAARPLAPEKAGRLFGWMKVAIVVGAAAMVGALGFGLSSRPWKFNRGVDYTLLIAWPLLLHLWRIGDRRWLAAVLAALATVTVLAPDGTGVVGAVAAVLVFAAARRGTAMVGNFLMGAVAAFAAAAPFALRAAAGLRGVLGPYVKSSLIARFEIWDYMTARVFERPLLGWGLKSGAFVPITPAELSTYRYANAFGNYPHNQWLELWLEMGLPGAVIGLGFALLVLARARRLPADMVPFALAAFTMAFCISLTSFGIDDDSWWAALAACGYLFSAVAGLHPARK